MAKISIDTQVRKYIDSVTEAIKNEYGSFPYYYTAQIEQLKNAYKIYLRAAEALNNESLVVTMSNKMTAPNLNFSIMKSCLSDMDKIIKGFGLNPQSIKRIRGKADTPEDEDFMSEL